MDIPAQDPIQPVMPQSLVEPVTPTTPNVPPKKFSLIPLLLSLLLLATLSLAGYLYSQNTKLKSQITTTPSPTPPATVDPTAMWKTYTYKDLTFKYPESWSFQGEDNYIRFDTSLHNDNRKINYFMQISNETEKNIGEWSQYPETTKLKTQMINEQAIDSYIVADMYYSLNYILRHNGEIYRIMVYPYEHDGYPLALDNTINQILSTFKFTKESNSDKKIGFIKEIRPNYDVYAIDIDYIEMISDKTAPNGFRIDNPSPTITTLLTDFVSDISPLITMQSGKEMTFSQLIKGFDEEPEKWRGIPFLIETKNGPVMKITEQYIP